MGAKRKIGRPRKRPEQRQDWRVSINLTQAEFEALDEAAGEESISAFVARVLREYLTRRESAGRKE